MVAKTDQIVRVLVLAHALSQSKRGIAIREFAKRRGFPPRTVYRDLKSLESAGFPLVEPSPGRYRFAEGWTPPTAAALDRDETLALFVARQLMSSARATSMGRALDRVWTKLTGTGTQTTLFPDTAPWFSVRAPVGIDYSGHSTTIATLERGLREQRVIECTYRSRSGSVTTRELEPGTLHWDPSLETLYLIAYCRLRCAIRIFAVHRILEAIPRDETFRPRADARSESVLRHAFRVWRSDAIQTVSLRFRGRAAMEIAERTWHASQRLERRGGAVLLTLQVGDAAELERWIMGFGPDVEILQPADLAARVAELHRQAAIARPRSRARRRESVPADGTRRSKTGTES